MKKEEMIAEVNKWIDESAEAMKKEVPELLKAREWDLEQFGDRNTFPRLVLQALLKKESEQYAPIQKSRAISKVQKEMDYELAYIHV